MRVLLLCDDYWHPGQIVIDGTAPLAEQGFEFDVITGTNDFSSDMLRHYPVVLLAKSDETSDNKTLNTKTSWKTQEMQQVFASYVENGGGLVAVHSATVSGENTKILDSLIGCRFLAHPDACPVTVAPLKKHPITEGVETFCETDEHYSIEITAPDADILLASYSPAQREQAAGFVRTQGKGRVCVLTPGHNLEVWLNPQFLRLLENAINWTAGK